MVAVAMQENWEAIDEHIQFMDSLFARLIQDGIEAGEFAPCDTATVAELVGLGCGAAFHPATIADCAGDDSEHLVRGLARLLVRGLRQVDPNPDSNVVPLIDTGSRS